MKIRFVLVVVAGVFTASAVYTSAAQEPSVLAGTYSAEQAKRGEALYAQECAACHGEKLTGMDPIPGLAGADFQARWKNLGELFEKIQTTMPAISPGSMNGMQVADVLAHMLAVNKYPAGTTELPSKMEALTPIKLEPAK